MNVHNIKQQIQSDNNDLNTDPNFCSESIISGFSQAELDLVRDLYLSKESSELLTSRLKEKKMLKSGTNISFDADFVPFFTRKTISLFVTMF